MKKRPRRQVMSIPGHGDKIEVTFDGFFIGLADGERRCQGKQKEKKGSKWKREGDGAQTSPPTATSCLQTRGAAEQMIREPPYTLSSSSVGFSFAGARVTWTNTLERHFIPPPRRWETSLSEENGSFFQALW